ncbi:ferredoxin [Streptomyces sp. NPDC006743]|uniref:ferredoxin n=1 Tax=Streptomyces sp. NPDC006743 TaxID=3154480 RepID=UPI00345368F1
MTGRDQDPTRRAPGGVPAPGEEAWRVQVDEKACMATGICAGVAPGRFQIRDGASHPTSPTTEPAPEVVDAAESCPMEAILVTHRDTGVRIAPEE